MEQQNQPATKDQKTPAVQKPVNPETELLKDLTIGLPSAFKLLEESFMLFRKKYLSFITVLLISILPVYLISKIPLIFQISQTFYTTLLFNFIGYYIAIILFSLGYLALLFAIKDNEENISVFDCYKRAKKHFLEYWKILLIFITVSVSGLISFVIPGFIFTIWFSLALMVYLVEEIRGVDSLLMSKQYIQGYWTSVFSRLIFLGIFIALMSLPLVILRPLLSGYLYEAMLVLTVLVILPIANTYLFLIYGNLRLLKPNTIDLIEALGNIKEAKVKLRLLKPAILEGSALGVPLIIFVTYLFLIRLFQVQTDTMTPALKAKEIMTVNVLAYRSDEPERGDIIILQSTVDPKKNLIMRIVGLPTERILIRNGGVYINDSQLDESKYLKNSEKTISGNFLQENYTLPIPSGQYAVLGDNRLITDDSREWGFIRKGDIIGKAGYCIWNCPKNTD